MSETKEKSKKQKETMGPVAFGTFSSNTLVSICRCIKGRPAFALTFQSIHIQRPTLPRTSDSTPNPTSRANT